VKAGNLTVHREVKGSEGFGATSPYRVHFGLSAHTRVDSIEVFWGTRVMRLPGVRANQLLTIREDEH
jgi:hypothetical protein